MEGGIISSYACVCLSLIHICIFQNPKPKVKDVVRCLKKEAEVTDNTYMKMELSMNGKKRKTKYLKIDERIQRTVQNYEGTGDIKSCLKAIFSVKNSNE